MAQDKQRKPRWAGNREIRNKDAEEGYSPQTSVGPEGVPSSVFQPRPAKPSEVQASEDSEAELGE